MCGGHHASLLALRVGQHNDSDGEATWDTVAEAEDTAVHELNAVSDAKDILYDVAGFAAAATAMATVFALARIIVSNC
jgi:hypothetical protein